LKKSRQEFRLFQKLDSYVPKHFATFGKSRTQMPAANFEMGEQLRHVERTNWLGLSVSYLLNCTSNSPLSKAVIEVSSVVSKESL